MKNFITILSFFISCLTVQAQEFNATVNIDYSQVQGSYTQVFNTLQTSLQNFINSTRWTDLRLSPHEKIQANFLIIISQREGNNRFKASLQVQSKRPVFNSGYYTPILNLNDTNFDFEYTESEQLVFNDRRFSGKNLTDVISFYIYLILGYDADTFKKDGGTNYFKTAQRIANTATSGNYGGWSELDGMRSKVLLINNILKPDNNTLRTIWYQYHRMGLDAMADGELKGKNAIGTSLNTLKFYANGSYSLFYPLEIFITAKKEEISKIFNGGLTSTVDINQLKETLNSISPTNAQLWNNLKK